MESFEQSVTKLLGIQAIMFKTSISKYFPLNCVPVVPATRALLFASDSIGSSTESLLVVFWMGLSMDAPLESELTCFRFYELLLTVMLSVLFLNICLGKEALHHVDVLP